jgi:hypothetical protein
MVGGRNEGRKLGGKEGRKEGRKEGKDTKHNTQKHELSMTYLHEKFDLFLLACTNFVYNLRIVCLHKPLYIHTYTLHIL